MLISPTEKNTPFYNGLSHGDVCDTEINCHVTGIKLPRVGISQAQKTIDNIVPKG